MEKDLLQEDKRYRGRDLMNTQKKDIYQKLIDEIKKQK
jgi:hypothetical protein